MGLLDRYGLDEAARERRQQFLGLSPDDAAALRSLRPVFAEHAREFAERFYEHLLRDDRAAALLADPARLERLKTIQTQYFAELLEGTFDAAYFEKRLQVGLAHQRVGLEPVPYLGAYNQYVQLTFPLFARALAANERPVMAPLLALVKVIFLDIGLALETYFHEATEQLRSRNDELQKALALYRHAGHREEQMRKLLSHEVRGGLAAVIAMLDDVIDQARDRLDAPAIEQLQSASQRCWSLARLLGDMLTAARYEGPSRVELPAIFENLAARFDGYTDGRDIQLVLPREAPAVWADALQLREVFANLVSNAARCLDKEPGRVVIGCRVVDAIELPPGHPAGRFCLFGVADNGPGLPASVCERLFEPFVRGPAVPGRPQGTGLGLYFVRSIVEEGGGRIWVESVPGEGANFWFTVPLAPATATREGG